MTVVLGGFIGGLGLPELVVIAFVGLLLFGTRLPKLARSLGQSVNEFKQGMKDPAQPFDPPKDPAERTEHRN